MQKIEIKYNPAFISNQTDGEETSNLSSFDTQQNININQEYFSYNNIVGISVVNDLNVKAFLDKPENEKIAVEFIQYLRSILTLDEFRDLFYDNKKLADFFNDYYKKFISYSNQGIDESTNDTTVNLDNKKKQLFNEEGKYLKSNTRTNYYTNDPNVQQNSQSPNNNYGERILSSDLIDYTGDTECYYLNFKIDRKINVIDSEDFSEYFKDTCDGTFTYKKFTYKNEIQKTDRYINIDDLKIMQSDSANNSNYGPDSEFINYLKGDLPKNIPTINKPGQNGAPPTITVAYVPGTSTVQIESGVYVDVPPSIISLPQGTNRANFRSIQNFFNFFNFRYKPYSPNFQIPDDANYNYLYTQVIFEDSNKPELLRNNSFQNDLSDWYVRQPQAATLPQIFLGSPWFWSAYRGAGRNTNSGQPLWQIIPSLETGIYRIKIKINYTNPNSELRVQLGLGLGNTYLAHPDSFLSGPIVGNGEFEFLLRFNRSDGRDGQVAPGIVIRANSNWNGVIEEISLRSTDDVNFYYDQSSNNLNFIGQKIDPLTDFNTVKLKCVTQSENTAKKVIVQYEPFSTALIGPDDGYNNFSFLLPGNNDLTKTSFELDFIPYETEKEFELKLYKNFNVRVPIVLSLRYFDYPGKISSYIVIYLEEFFNIPGYVSKEELIVKYSNKCNLLYNGFVRKNYNENFLQKYRPQELKLTYENGQEINVIEQFSESLDSVVNPKLFSIFNDGQINLENLIKATKIPLSSIFNIYVYGKYYFENENLKTKYDIVMVSDSSSEETIIEFNGLKILLIDPIAFQTQLNSFSTIVDDREMLLSDNNFFLYFTQDNNFKILERINFTTNLTRESLKSKAIEVSNSQYLTSIRFFRSKDFEEFRMRVWNSIRILKFAIQYLKFGKVTNRLEANAYLDDLKKPFTDFNEVNQKFEPIMIDLKNELLSL